MPQLPEPITEILIMIPPGPSPLQPFASISSLIFVGIAQFGFRPLLQAADIGSMFPDHHGRQAAAEQDIPQVVPVKQQHGRQKADRRQNGSQRHNASQQHSGGKDRQHNQKHPPIERQNHSGGAHDALAALEPIVHRKNVPQHSHAAGIERRLRPNQPSSHPHGQNGLEPVAQHHQQRLMRAKIPQRVGGAGVAASHLPDILVVKQFGYCDRGAERAQQIGANHSQPPGPNTLWKHDTPLPGFYWGAASAPQRQRPRPPKRYAVILQ